MSGKLTQCRPTVDVEPKYIWALTSIASTKSTNWIWGNRCDNSIWHLRCLDILDKGLHSTHNHSIQDSVHYIMIAEHFRDVDVDFFATVASIFRLCVKLNEKILLNTSLYYGRLFQMTNRNRFIRKCLGIVKYLKMYNLICESDALMTLLLRQYPSFWI